MARENQRSVPAKAGEIYDAGNRGYKVRYRVVEADDLSATTQKAANQYRGREGNIASDAQIQSIAQSPNYQRVNESSEMSTGAPTLANDGTTVIAGNGRLLGLSKAYQDGTAAQYKADLIADAQAMGFDAQAVAQMDKPVLVREFVDNVDVSEMAIQSNEGQALAMSELENARADAERLPDLSALDAHKGEINKAKNKGFIRSFVNLFPKNQHNALMTPEGLLSQEGERRLKNAILYQAYGDSSILRALVSDTNPQRQRVLNALTQVAPKVAQAKARIANGTLPALDISNDIVAVVAKLSQLSANGQSVSSYLAQHSLLAADLSPTGRQLLAYLEANKHSGRAIFELFDRYYGKLLQQQSPQNATLFATEPVTSEQLFTESLHEQAEQGRPLGESFPDTGSRPQQTEPDGAGVERTSQSSTDNTQTPTDRRQTQESPPPLDTPNEATAPDQGGFLFDNAPVIDGKTLEVTQEELAKSDTRIKALRAKAKKLAMAFVGMRKNIASGFNIKVGAKGIKHTITGAQDDLLSTLPYLDKIIEQSAYISSAPDVKGNKAVKQHHYFGIRYRINGKTKNIIVDVREMNDGKYYYDHAFTKETANDDTHTGGELLPPAPITQSEVALADADNIHQNQAKAQEDAQIRADLEQSLGKKAASKVVIDREGKSAGKYSEDAKGAEGWYTKGDKVYINPDMIDPLYDSKGNEVLSRAERIAFVAWHELGHRGVEANQLWERFEQTLKEASNNPFVAELAQAIQADRAKKGKPISNVVAVEEALVEINAAMISGKMEVLQASWGVKAPFDKNGVASFYRRLVEILQRVVGHITGKPKALSNQQLLELLQTITDGATAPVSGRGQGAQFSQSPMKSTQANIKRGREAMNKALTDKTSVHRAMYRNDIGWIDFVWGDAGRVKASGKTKGGKGLSHIIESRMRKDSMSYGDVVQMLTERVVDTIAKGQEVGRWNRGSLGENIRIEHNGNRVALSKRKGSNAWVVTAFDLYEDAGGKGNDNLAATDTDPTLARADTGASYEGNTKPKTKPKQDDDIKFSIGKRARANYENQIRKRNPNISEAHLKESLDFLHELEDSKKNTKAIKVAVKWLANDTIRLPFAMENVREAIALSEKHKIDPMQFNSPMEIINKYYVDVEYGKAVHPDKLDGFSNKRTVGAGDYRVTIYDVEDSKTGQRAVSKLLHHHFGYSTKEDGSKCPWCLASFTKQGLPSNSAENYWFNIYNSVGKKIAFKDGKPIAFMAHDKDYAGDLWWDINDRPSNNLPLPDGRYLDPDGTLSHKKHGISGDQTQIRAQAIADIHDSLSKQEWDEVFNDVYEAIIFEEYPLLLRSGDFIGDLHRKVAQNAERRMDASFIEAVKHSLDNGSLASVLDARLSASGFDVSNISNAERNQFINDYARELAQGFDYEKYFDYDYTKKEHDQALYGLYSATFNNLVKEEKANFKIPLANREAIIGDYLRLNEGGNFLEARVSQKEAEIIQQEDHHVAYDDLKFSIGKRARANYENQIRKRNPNISEAHLKESLDFLHELEDSKENTKAIKVAVKWLANDTIRLPFAMDNVRKAIALSEKHKIDPMQFNSPMDIINKYYVDVEFGKPVNPDKLAGFSNKRTVAIGNTGEHVTIYDVEDSDVGQRAVTKVGHQHFGYSNKIGGSKCPWCLASFTRRGNPTSSAENFWFNTYNSVGKKIAFKDGKPIAFMAHDKDYDGDLWWDLDDTPSNNLPLPNGEYLDPDGSLSDRKGGDSDNLENDEYYNDAVENMASNLSDTERYDIIEDLYSQWKSGDLPSNAEGYWESLDKIIKNSEDEKQAFIDEISEDEANFAYYRDDILLDYLDFGRYRFEYAEELERIIHDLREEHGSGNYTDIKFSLPPTNAELESQLADTVKRYGGKPAYDKAKKDGKTKLTYRQYFQVRLPAFKQWFGDWELAAKGGLIDNLSSVAVTGKPLNNEQARQAYDGLRDGENKTDGRKTRFVRSSLGKITRHQGFDTTIIIPQLKDIFDSSAPIYSEQEIEKAGHKKHNNFVGYHNYLNKIKVDGQEYFVRITLQEVKAKPETLKRGFVPNELHSTFVSEIEIYNTDPTVHTKNSLATDAGISAIDKKLQQFFDDVKRAQANTSKVVDPDTGEPMVVYHGTDADFSVFDKDKIGQNFGEYSFGFNFISEPKVAEQYGKASMPLFLSVKNPFVFDVGAENVTMAIDKDRGYLASQIVQSRKTETPFDAILAKDNSDNVQVVALNPNQIKSAVANKGGFTPDNDDIRFSLASGVNDYLDKKLGSDGLSAKDNIVRKMADKFLPVKLIQQEIEKNGGKLDLDNDVYLAEERYHGKLGYDVEVMERYYVEPLVKILAQHNLTQADLDKFLIARHAEERNIEIAKRNDKFPDGGSGMKTAEAKKILAEFGKDSRRDGLLKAAQIVDAMTKKRLQLLEVSGLIDEDTANTWREHYRYYVPLKGIAKDNPSGKKDRPRTGKGFSIGGKESKTALGRSSMATSPSSYVVNDLSETLVRARKNEVGQHLLRLVQDNPNPECVSPDCECG